MFREVFNDDPDEAELEDIVIAPPNLSLLGVREDLQAAVSRRTLPQAPYPGGWWPAGALSCQA